MNSFIVKFFSGIYSRILNNILDSTSYAVFYIVSDYLKNAAKKSIVLGYFINPPAHKKTNESITKRLSKKMSSTLIKVTKPVNEFIAKTIKNSKLIKILYNFYSNIMFVPLRSFGVMAVTAGTTYVVLTGILSEIGPRSIIAFAVLVAGGGIMLLFKSSVYEILEDSFIIRIIIGKNNNFDALNLTNNNNDRKHYPTVIVLGLIMATLPVLLPTMYAAAGIAALFAVPVIMIWPITGLLALSVSIAFIPTMAATGLIALTWISAIVNNSLGRISFKGILEKGKPVLIFILITISGGILSFAISDSILIAAIYTSFISSVYLFLALIKDKITFRSVIFLMATAAFVTALYGLYQYLTGNITVGWVDSEMFEGIVRIYSTFENPNVYGEYLLFMIPLSLMFFFMSKRVIYKLFWIGAGFTMVVAILLTMSRGCWIGLVVGVFIYFLIADRRFLWLFFIAVIILPFVLPESIMFRLLSIGNLEDSSSLYRLFIWLGTFRMLGDYWLTGVGLGTKAFSGIYSAYAYNGIIAPHPHNLYLNVISELGIAGFISLAWITLKSLRYGISTSISNKSIGCKHTGAAITAAFSGILVQGIFDNVFYNYRIVLIFWIFTAMAFTYYNLNKVPTEVLNDKN